MKRAENKIVIGIDPGLRATGYAVLETAGGDLALRASGEIRSAAKQPLERRLQKIFEELEAVLKAWKPSAVALEKLYSSYSFPYTAIIMGHVRGVICLAAVQVEAEVMEIPSTEAKKALTGYGRASKEQVGRAVMGLLGLDEPPASEHIADAMALGAVGAMRAAYPRRDMPD